MSRDRYRLVRELGSRVVPTWAALDSQAASRNALVVIERIARGGEYGDADIGDWVRDARRLARLEHPNVARVRDVVIRGEEVLVASDFVDGVKWSDLAAGSQRPSLEVTLRVFLDVLAGLSALHDLRDEHREPLRLMHGELTPECIIVGPEGVSRIVSACRLRSATARPGRAGSAYLAPEILLADDSADARADVYSVGVMLWEALSGRPLFPNTQPAAIVTHLLSGRIPRATIPEGNAWAEPLVDLVKRALSVEPDKRFDAAAALALEIKHVGGARIATSARLAAFVRATFGDRVRQRREALQRGEDRVATTGPPYEGAAALPPPAKPAPPAPGSRAAEPPRPPPVPRVLRAAAQPLPAPVSPPEPSQPAAFAEPSVLAAAPAPAPPTGATVSALPDLATEGPPPMPSIPGPPMMPDPGALAAPRVPADLLAAATALNAPRKPALSSAPTWAPITGVALEESSPSQRRRRGGAWLAPLVFGLAVASGAGLWWALGRRPAAQAATLEHAPVVTAAPSAVASAPPTPPPSAVVAPPPLTAEPAVSIAAPPEPAASVSKPKVVPRRPVDRGKYDPEGI